MFENIGPMELLMVLVIVLVLFGAKRVPEIGASIGKGIRELKRGMSDLSEPEQAPAPIERAAPADHAPAAEQHTSVEQEPKRLLG